MFSKPIRCAALGLLLLRATGGSAVDAPTLTAPCGGMYDPAVTIMLLWNSVPGADSYSVQVSMDPNFTMPEMNLQAGGSSLVISGLYYDALYNWRVQTEDGGVLSAWSTPCSFTTTTLPAPTAPLLYLPTNGSSGQGTSVFLQWTFIPATAIEVQVSTNALFTIPIIINTQGQFVTVNGLVNGQTYHWRVRGSNIGGTGPWSDVWTFSVGPSTTSISLRMLLQGPLNTGTLLMDDGLRAAGLVPVTEPYTASGWTLLSNASATIGAGVLATTGNNAVVDWVLLEARHATTHSVLGRWALLVQRDGDLMMPSGASINLTMPAAQVKLAVRHRNHLGAMCTTAFNSNTSITADLTLPATPLFGANAMTTVGGARALWSGDSTGNGELKYTGAGNDRDPILLAIGGTTPTNTVSGYRMEDVNLDGVVKYTGANNDRDPILANIGGSTPTAVRLAQLP